MRKGLIVCPYCLDQKNQRLQEYMEQDADKNELWLYMKCTSKSCLSEYISKIKYE